MSVKLASMPWQVARALPCLDVPTSPALVVPNYRIQAVEAEGLFGPGKLVWRLWTGEKEVVRQCLGLLAGGLVVCAERMGIRTVAMDIGDAKSTTEPCDVHVGILKCVRRGRVVYGLCVDVVTGLG